MTGCSWACRCYERGLNGCCKCCIERHNIPGNDSHGEMGRIGRTWSLKAGSVLANGGHGFVTTTCNKRPNVPLLTW